MEIKRTGIFAPFQASVRKSKSGISKYMLKKKLKLRTSGKIVHLYMALYYNLVLPSITVSLPLILKCFLPSSAMVLRARSLDLQASALPGNLSEMQIIGPSTALLNLKLGR